MSGNNTGIGAEVLAAVESLGQATIHDLCAELPHRGQKEIKDSIRHHVHKSKLLRCVGTKVVPCHSTKTARKWTTLCVWQSTRKPADKPLSADDIVRSALSRRGAIDAVWFGVAAECRV
jgi:hypothetical protein